VRAGARTGDLVGATLILAVVAITVRLLVTGEYLIYVKPSMAPFLAATAVFLTGLAGWTFYGDVRPARVREPRGPAPGLITHGHRLPAIAWLLLVPVLVIVVVAPRSLGAFTAARNAPASPPVSAAGFRPLPPGDPVGLPLEDYVARSLFGGQATLEGRRVSLLGFVTPSDSPGSWYLTRLQLRCCAADALPLRVAAVGAPDQPPDTWLVVTGRYLPATSNRVAQLQVEQIEPAAEPEMPYVFG
jgi:uncharacterized repeat protein (TIGR03943 family)